MRLAGGPVFVLSRDLSSRDNYRLMIGSIVPRPIAWVTTISNDGIVNLAPFSFFMGICETPPCICFSPIHRDGQPKDTLRNVLDTREFVLNVVTEDVATAMNATSEEVPPEVDELALAGLTPLPSAVVRPPRVAEAPIHLECRVIQLVDVGHPPQGSTLVIGEILAWHIRDDLYDAERQRVRVDRLHAVGRLAGDGYTRTREQFEMVRPNPNYQGR
ncbi:MAG: flavin reductase family protein [Chloroflexi bacterium]|nr:flavin reductase family protein [Chloroflexota bacterium]